MNILFIVPYPPSLIRNRAYFLIGGLSGRNHTITIATLWSNAEEMADIKRLRAAGYRVVARPLPKPLSWWNSLLALPTGRPLQAHYCWQPALAHDMAQLLYKADGQPAFDLIHVEHLRGSSYGLALKQQMVGRPAIPIVWDSVDCISYLFRQTRQHSRNRLNRWLASLDLPRTERYEGWLASQFEHVLLTSPVDKEAILSLSPTPPSSDKVSIIPSGVDLDYFRPGSPENRQKTTLVISGKMSYHANVTMSFHLVRDIMPLVWAKRPDIQLYIVGKDPPRELMALNTLPTVTVTGTVADLRPYLQQATIALAPLMYNAGVQCKILEAMACETPVITTPNALAGLRAVPGRDLLIAPDPPTFAETILNLLDDPAGQHKIGASGRNFIQNHHNWATLATELEGIYYGLIH